MQGVTAPADIETIGKYELLEEIGQGNMGRVWRARDPFTGREVAVKIAQQPEHDSERGERRRRKLFFNEVKAAGMLRHPNIVATMDAGVDDGRRYIVMEYVRDARTLADFATPERRLPLATVLRIMQQCATAFDYAHSRGVVHRDIKPTNIMLDREGQAKICDFGVAFINRADVDETQVMGRLGSPRYMAPEQLSGDEVTHLCDIYSLGVVTYELLTGVSPFAGRHVGEIARKVLKEPHRPIRELDAEIPERLAAIIDRTLKKHPAGRYQSAMELAADLQLIREELEFTDLKRSGPDAVKFLQRLSSFHGFETHDLEELLAVAGWEEHGAGEVVAAEGEGDSSAVVVVRGKLHVVCGETRIARLGPGATCGDFGLVEAGERGAEIHAAEDSTLLRIRASQAASLSPACARQLYLLLASGYAARLQQLQRRIHRRGRRQ